MVLFVAACGDSDTDEETDTAEAEAIAQAVTQCQPDPGYDSCYETDWATLDYWQDTLPDPRWRSVQSSSEPDFDYEVAIDAVVLNAGVIPTHPGQGHYSSWSEYRNALTDLIGVDPTSYDILVTIEGVSMKVDDNNDPVPYGATPGSTSHFIHDALSDEDGRIFVDSQDVTADLLSEHQAMEYEIEVDGQPLSSGSSQTDYFGESQSNPDPDLTMTLEDGAWSAKFTLTGFPDYVPGHSRVDSAISELEIDDPTVICIYMFDPNDMSIELHCPTADKFEIDLASYLDYQGSTFWYGPATAVETDTAELQVSVLHKGSLLDACAIGDAEFIDDLRDDGFLTTTTDCPLLE